MRQPTSRLVRLVLADGSSGLEHPGSRTGVYTCQHPVIRDCQSGALRLPTVGRRVDLDDLIDAAEVASILGLARANSVYVYRERYSDMPRPVLDRGSRQAKLWLRSEVTAWQQEQLT